MKFRVAAVDEIPEGGVRLAVADGRRFALVKLAGVVRALGDTCPHAGGPLSEGVVENGTLRCPWHARHFDVSTGLCVDFPKTNPATCVPVEISGADVLIDL